MTVKDRYTDTGGVHPDCIVTQDLLRLPNHLHLLPGITVLLKCIDLGQHVKRYLPGMLRGQSGFAVEQGNSLLLQLFNRLFSFAGYCLVSGDIDALNTGGVVNGFPTP